jgi:hypothetical protein
MELVYLNFIAGAECPIKYTGVSALEELSAAIFVSVCV